ncbi:hypothetical protein HRE53_12285 [Acaryochloris sp. 'Moss Beach']|nr:hypothetical protein HRE53_12285 [Acaryochloris sp. 'Moss Beach']
MAKKRAYHFDHVLVIGNGFDLDLGLATDYGSFLESESV